MTQLYYKYNAAKIQIQYLYHNWQCIAGPLRQKTTGISQRARGTAAVASQNSLTCVYVALFVLFLPREKKYETGKSENIWREILGKPGTEL